MWQGWSTVSREEQTYIMGEDTVVIIDSPMHNRGAERQAKIV